MAAGIQLGKGDLDQRLGSLSLQVNTIMTQWSALKAFVDGLQDTDLQAMGYTAADITSIRAAMIDTGQIVGIFTGQTTLAAVKDFRTNIKRFWGAGY